MAIVRSYWKGPIDGLLNGLFLYSYVGLPQGIHQLTSSMAPEMKGKPLRSSS